MRTTRFLRLTAFLAMALVLVLGSVTVEAANGVDTKNKTINIGVVGPLTGQYGVYGQAQKKGVELFVKEFNEAGGISSGELKGYKLAPTYFDDKGDPKESANIAQKIVIGDYFAEVGPTNSSPAAASAPLYDRNNVSMILVYAGDYRLTHSGYTNVFRIGPTSLTEGYGYLDLSEKLSKTKKVAEIWENTAYGQTLHQYFEERAKQKKVDLVGSETFVAGQDLDFRNILFKLKEKNPDVLMANVTYNDGGMIVNQARKMGWDVAILGAIGCNAPKYTEMMPDQPGEVYLAVVFNQLSSDPKIQSFIAKYDDHFGEKPSEASALAYDATRALVEAIQLGATKREEVKNYMHKVDFQGITNHIKFADNGDVSEPSFPCLKLGPDKQWTEYKLD